MLDIKGRAAGPEAVAAALNKRGYRSTSPPSQPWTPAASRRILTTRTCSRSARRLEKIGQLVGQGVPVEEAKARVNDTWPGSPASSTH